MLPKLYTLRVRAVVGHVQEVTPWLINCPACGREADHYRRVVLALDEWPRCDVIAAAGAVDFVSERLLADLRTIGASGYSDWPADLTLSEEFHRRHPSTDVDATALPPYRHLVVTGRCDGPWIEHARGKCCPHCQQPSAEFIDFEASARWMIGDAPAPMRLVYTDTWHGEDFFQLSEPGLTIVTDRIAEILDRTGNLRTEAVGEREMAQRFLPKYAERLERMGWEVPVCVSLGPADWVERS